MATQVSYAISHLNISWRVVFSEVLWTVPDEELHIANAKLFHWYAHFVLNHHKLVWSDLWLTLESGTGRVWCDSLYYFCYSFCQTLLTVRSVHLTCLCFFLFIFDFSKPGKNWVQTIFSGVDESVQVDISSLSIADYCGANPMDCSQGSLFYIKNINLSQEVLYIHCLNYFSSVIRLG